MIDRVTNMKELYDSYNKNGLANIFFILVSIFVIAITRFNIELKYTIDSYFGQFEILNMVFKNDFLIVISYLYLIFYFFSILFNIYNAIIKYNYIEKINPIQNEKLNIISYSEFSHNQNSTKRKVEILYKFFYAVAYNTNLFLIINSIIIYRNVTDFIPVMILTFFIATNYVVKNKYDKWYFNLTEHQQQLIVDLDNANIDK